MLTYERIVTAIHLEVREDQERIYTTYTLRVRVIDTDTGEQFGDTKTETRVADVAGDPVLVAAEALCAAVMAKEIAADPTGSIAQRQSAAAQAAAASVTSPPSLGSL